MDNESACLETDEMERFLAGVITPEERTRVELHIDACDWCRRALSELVRSFDDLDDPPRASASPWAVKRGTSVGRYVIEGPLGFGGMGVVYAGYDPKLDRKVAVKMMHAPSDRGAGTSDRLEHEARTMAKLSHPNVVTIYDIGVFEGQLFLAMELIDGVTLRSWLAYACRPADRIIGAFIQAGRGLAAAHAAGLVHRDFKPDNVLCTPQGRVYVTDFGLAYAAAREPGASPPVAGTAPYIAPEVYAGKPADARSDQFGFCVALYEALYRQHPFEGTTWVERTKAAREGRIREPPDDAVVLPRAQAALHRGLRADPTSRFGSMADLLDVLSNEPATRRWRLAAMLTAAIAVIAVPLSYWHARTQSLRACDDPNRLTGIWNEGRKNRVRQAFLQTSKPFADHAWNSVEHALDAYTRDWALARTAACEGMHLHRGDPVKSAAYATCLDERLENLAALTEVFEQADRVVVSRAVSAVQSLPPIATCNRPSPSRSNPNAGTAKAEAIRNELTKVHALREAGKYRDALDRAKAAVGAAEAIEDPRMQGEALFHYADVLGVTGDVKASETTLRNALAMADVAHDDLTRARAWSRLLYDVGYLQGKHELVPWFNELAEAALKRAGGDDALDALRRYYLGTTLVAQGRFDAAIHEFDLARPVIERAFGPNSIQMSQCYLEIGIGHLGRSDFDASQAAMLRALEIGEGALGANHPQLALVHNTLGVMLQRQTRFDEAHAQYLRALGIEEESVGEEFLTLAVYLHNVGEILLEQGQYERARTNFERDLAIRTRQLGTESPQLLFPYWGLGEAYLGLGDPKTAMTYLERAVQAKVDADAESTLAEARFALARALWATGGLRHRAHSLAVEAREGFAKSPQVPLDQRNLHRVEQWLAEHRVPRELGMSIR